MLFLCTTVCWMLNALIECHTEFLHLSVSGFMRVQTGSGQTQTFDVRARAGKITCASCSRICKDQAVKIGDKHFHVSCFVCKGLQFTMFFTTNISVRTSDELRAWCAS